MTISNTVTGRLSYGLTGPLNEMNPLPVLALRDPTTEDINYPIGQVWINQNSNAIFIITSVAVGAANWDSIGGIGEDPITQYVVSPDGSGDYLTIQTAITAANTAGGVAMIYIKGNATTYTENLTLYDNIILIGEGIQTNITGVHTPPDSGAVLMSNIYFISATDVFTSAAAGTTRLRFTDCTFNCTNGWIVDCASWTGPIDFHTCHNASTSDGVVRVGASTVAIENSYVGDGANALSITGGTLAIRDSRIGCPISPAGANAGSINGGSFIGGTVTLAGTSAMSVSNSTLSTGATAAFTQSSAGVLTVTDSTITSSNNPAIDGAGAGAVTLSNVNFTSNSLLAATLTRAYVAETKATRLACGDATYRVTTVGPEFNVAQAYLNDLTETGASALVALEGNTSFASGDGSHTPYGVKGSITAAATGNSLAAVGVYGVTSQVDGAVIASTAAGVEGHLDILETDAADIPQVFAFGVKGYLDAADTTATPLTGIFAGIGSIVEYNTPFNAVAYGVAVSRLDAGAGTGTAGLAAYGVVQGTVAIADWLYGIDLYNGAAGVAYTTADIRLWDQSTIKADGTTLDITCIAGNSLIVSVGDDVGSNFFAVTNFSDNSVFTVDSLGDLTCRNVDILNTDITFNSNPVLQSILATGAVPSGATGATNIMACQEGVMMEEFLIGAGQTLIAPRMEADGLLISLDLVNTEGVEYNFGVFTSARHQFVVGTSPAFFVEAKFKVADSSGCEPLFLGFRTVGANDADYVNYNDIAGLGIITAQNADLVTIATRQGGAVTYTNSTDAFADGETHTLRINVSAAGVVTYLIDGAAPTGTAAYTFTGAISVMPYISLLHAAAAPGAIHLEHIKCGRQEG